MPRRPRPDNRKTAVAVIDLTEDGRPVVLEHFKHTLQAYGWSVYPYKRKPDYPSIELVEVATAPARGVGVYVIAGVKDYAKPLLPHIRRVFTFREVRESEHPLADAVRKAWRAKDAQTDFIARKIVAGVDIGERAQRDDWGDT